MKRRGISVRDKMDTFNLSFELQEFLESLSDNLINHPESNVYSNGKRAWFGDVKPEVINQIDRQLRKRYNIQENIIILNEIFEQFSFHFFKSIQFYS